MTCYRCWPVRARQDSEPKHLALILKLRAAHGYLSQKAALYHNEPKKANRIYALATKYNEFCTTLMDLETTTRYNAIVKESTELCERLMDRATGLIDEGVLEDFEEIQSSLSRLDGPLFTVEPVTSGADSLPPVGNRSNVVSVELPSVPADQPTRKTRITVAAVPASQCERKGAVVGG